ncbi:serine protease [Nocardia sp. NPDC051570]|uniref:serine protease n=1 Tax=Nocardia sp. NPDC051570 TaxID=3364324 RepID=UPI003791BE91
MGQPHPAEDSARLSDHASVKIKVNAESVRSVFIEMFFNDHKMACGTGFFYFCDHTIFLVTARHCLTGRHWETNKLMENCRTEPDTVRIHVRRADRLEAVEWIDRPLYDEELCPMWLEHPEFGRAVDVVALPVVLTPDFLVAAWECPDVTDLVVTQELSIIGYPLGLKGDGDLAIWTRGTIATEPTLSYRNLPMFLIDSRTRKGQSGSPVALFHRPGSLITASDGQPRYATGPVSSLVGVYTGRISPDSDLGFVWNTDLLETICRRGVHNRLD